MTCLHMELSHLKQDFLPTPGSLKSHKLLKQLVKHWTYCDFVHVYTHNFHYKWQWPWLEYLSLEGPNFGQDM